MKNHAAECVHKTRRAAALLAGALALSLLAGCTKDESQPVVTDDDLTPSSAVQTALDLEAGNGKTYAYVLEIGEYDLAALSWEEAEAAALEWHDQAIRSAQNMVAEIEESGTPEELENAKSYLNELQSDAEREEVLARARKDWETQQDLDPVVSPQEAANRAGSMFEEAYGIDLTGKELRLSCFRSPESGRVLWEVWNKFEDFGGNIQCQLDATTGEYVQANYSVLTDEENEKILQCPRPDCYVQYDPNDPSFYHYDPDAPSYPQLIETLKADMQGALSGSSLVEGAAITSIEAELVRQNWAIELHVTCDNGKTYTLGWQGPGANHAGYDCGGYPLRGYGFSALGNG